MLDTLRDLLTQAQGKISNIAISNEAMRYILWYAATLIFSVSIYLFAWIYEWHLTGKPDLAELRNFIHEIASSPWVAAIGFVAQMMVDKNKDGIPDKIEDEEERKQ